VTTVIVRFEGLDQHEARTDGDQVSQDATVRFALEAEGRTYPGLSATSRITAGSTPDEVVFETSPPSGYDGPMHHLAFGDCVERYVRSLIGPAGRGINMPWASAIQMSDNKFDLPADCSFEAG
jgi:hypothetical protein